MAGVVIEETGNKYGRLTVIEQAESSEHGFARWTCQCECGNVITTRGASLRNGGTKSCGCYAKDRASAANMRDFSQIGPAAVRTIYKKSAQKRGLVFDLSLEEFTDITQQPCFYCGAPPSNIYIYTGRRDGNLTVVYSGLDRVDNQKGYIMSNVVPCCKTCNIAKNNMDVNDFLNWVERLYKYSFGEEI